MATAGALIGVGTNQQAQAAQGAAGARSRSAQTQLAFAKENQKRAIAAAESPQQLAQLERNMANQERNLAREEKFLSNIDPTLVEASQQALRLLRGETSSAVDPVRRQRDRQRKLLVDQLREQLGPGAETSSAGMQALSRFDTETSGIISGTQQQALSGLLGTTQGSAQLGRQGISSQQNFGSQIAQGFGSIANRRVGAITGSQAGVASAGQAVTSSAGSQFVGQQLRGQAMSAFGGSLVQGGITGLTAMAGGFGGSGGSGAKPNLNQVKSGFGNTSNIA